MVHTYSFAQTNTLTPQIIPPTPDGALLARYAEVPVDHSTGVPKIEIPIYTLKSGSLTLPISLSFHAGGIKVKDFASEVGLGWVLNAGGMISRTILGNPDDRPAVNVASPFKTKDEIWNMLSAATTVSAKLNLKDQLDGMYVGQYEMQSDRYSYNFDGHTGIFRYDFLSNAVRTIPYAPLSISSSGTSPNTIYQIIDESGKTYDFSSCEYSDGYITGWRLKTITSSDGGSKIDFFYSQGKTIHEMNVSPTIVSGKRWITTNNNAPNSENYTDVKNNMKVVTHSPLQLDSIVTSNAVVILKYLDDRLDAGGKRLNNILIVDKSTRKTLQKIVLEQSYFGNNSTPNRVDSRLKLNKVNIYGSTLEAPLQYSFYYNESMTIPFYNAYDSSIGNTTGRFGFGEDYWGYYNGGNSAFPSEYMSFLQGSQVNIYGGSRNSNPATLQAYNIREIRYPTGGRVAFEFSPNGLSSGNYYRYPTTYPNAIGGLKVDKITMYDENNNVASKKSYEYNSIVAQDIDKYQFYYEQPVTHIVEGTSFPGTIMEQRYSFLDNSTKKILIANSLYSLGQSNGASCIYTRVTEYFGDKSNSIGKNVYEYEPPTPYGILGEALSKPQYLTAAQYDHGTFSPLLSSLETYRFVPTNGDYVIGKRVKNKYTTYHAASFNTGIQVARTKDYIHEGNGIWLYPNNYTDLDSYIHEFEYDNTSGFEDIRLLDSVITTEFTASGQEINEYTTYQYLNQTHLQPTSFSVKNSRNEIYTTVYKYPHDFAGQQPYSNMVNVYHDWTKVVQEDQYKNGQILKTAKTDYASWNSNNKSIFPQLVNFSNGSIAEPRIKYLGYSSTGNVLSVSKLNGAPLSYLWGYKDSYPVAEAANAAANEIMHFNFEEQSDFTGVSLDNTHVHTGKYAGKLVNTNSVAGQEKTVVSNRWIEIGQSSVSRRFKYSGWVYSTGPSTQIFLFMRNPGMNGDQWAMVDNVDNYTTGKWVFMEKEFDVPAGITGLNLRIDNNDPGTVWFDDLRLYPAGAQMTTYTYEPLVGMTSMSDAKNQVTYYEYDGFQRLRTVRDQNQNILKQICYDYAGQQTDCFSVPPVTPPPGTIYARISYENESSNLRWTRVDVVVSFYSDAACSQPISVSNLNVSYNKIQQYGGSGTTSYTVGCNGYSTVLQSQALIQQNDPNGNMVSSYYYSLTPGAGYQIP
ncbi:hypothetical protein GS399_05300 [Pedobacter sp. HMF7647]|uniref:RHS repeat protein n=1 Tax=Hufsiella arboris TaxID=2695275 RepID=A0A7K1Y7L3_9SPHI|nr:hypothetical protein [Hufsiella arboris]MXV50381.1 hypothetical protein [Hufsiella arboris]